MKRLILFRHARAESGLTGDRDRLRALTESGHDDAFDAGKTLITHQIVPDIALVSPATRCLQTWQAIAAMFPNSQWRTEPDLYLASADELLALADTENHDCVMLIAHNPGLHELALALCPSENPVAAKLKRKFPTAAIAVFDADRTSGWDVHTVLYRSDR